MWPFKVKKSKLFLIMHFGIIRNTRLISPKILDRILWQKYWYVFIDSIVDLQPENDPTY